MVMAVCSSDTTADAPTSESGVKYDTPAKLRAATMDKFREVRKLQGSGWGSPGDNEKLFMYLAEYLDASDIAMQATAADLVANLDYDIARAPFVKFLSKEYPLVVRMAALSRCVVGPVSPACQKMLNEYLPAPVAPPHFRGIAIHVSQATSPRMHEGLIREEHHGIIARRTLHLLGDVEPGQQRSRLLIAVYKLNRREVFKEIRSWYAVEASADVRQQ